MNDRKKEIDCSRIICWRRWGTAEKNYTEIIANGNVKNNLQATVFRGFDTNCPEKSGQGGGLQTVSMTELYDTVYPPRTPVVDGFLYGGTYLFVGAPKVGKS